MRIVLDARMISWPGIGRYTKHLISGLGKYDKTNHYLLLLKSEDLKNFKAPSKRFEPVEATIEPYSPAEQTTLARLISAQKPDLVHFLGPNQPLLYLGKQVTTIYDLTLLKFKNTRGGALTYNIKQAAFRTAFTKAVKRSALIFTISNTIKLELLEAYNLEPKKIVPTLLAAEALKVKAESVPKIKLLKRYLLYVGYAYPHKNLERLLEAFKKLLHDYPDLKLVLAGKDNFFYDKLRTKAASLGIEKSVVFTGYVSDGQLVTLYKNAAAFVFPSLSEGFGITPLEAMSFGVPVIASEASSIPEICGDAAVYFDPLDVGEMAAAIEDILEQPRLVERLRKKGLSRVKQFSWDEMALETLEGYKKVLKSEKS